MEASEQAGISVVRHFAEIRSSASKWSNHVLRQLQLVFLERLIKYETKRWGPDFPCVFNYFAPYKCFSFSYPSGMFTKFTGKVSCNQNVTIQITILFQDSSTSLNISYAKSTDCIGKKLWLITGLKQSSHKCVTTCEICPSWTSIRSRHNHGDNLPNGICETAGNCGTDAKTNLTEVF